MRSLYVSDLDPNEPVTASRNQSDIQLQPIGTFFPCVLVIILTLFIVSVPESAMDRCARRWANSKIPRDMALHMWDMPSNVQYDANSTSTPDQFIESEYVCGVLDALRDRMGESFSSFSFHVFNCGDSSITPASVNDPHPRKVLVYVADEKGTIPLELAKHYVAIFKGYLPDERKSGNIFPLALGCVNGVTNGTTIPEKDRELDVFFSGNLNRNRLSLYRQLSTLKVVPERIVKTAVAKPRMRYFLRLIFGTDFSREFERGYICFTRNFADGLSRAVYSEKLNNARIALCPGGFHSAETFRHYEAARAGCVIICERLPDNGLYRNAPVLQVDSWREGIELAHALLRDPDRLNDLHRKTLAWWDSRWSAQSVARDMQEKLERLVDSSVEPSRV